MEITGSQIQIVDIGEALYQAIVKQQIRDRIRYTSITNQIFRIKFFYFIYTTNNYLRVLILINVFSYESISMDRFF